MCKVVRMEISVQILCQESAHGYHEGTEYIVIIQYGMHYNLSFRITVGVS